MKFYKGNHTDYENGEFLAQIFQPNENVEDRIPSLVDANINHDRENKRSIRERIFCIMEHFQSQPAKRAFFIAFTSVMLSLLCSTYTITGYVTDIFNKTGSSFTEKNSSILIAVITLLTNLLFLYIVERLNRKVWLNYDEQLNNEL